MEPTERWTPQFASDLYDVASWGKGFSVGEKGHILVHPEKDPARSIDLKELVDTLVLRGINLPILIRFADILKHRLGELHSAFATAIAEHRYQAGYCCVYPIKVNQQRQVVEEVLEFGKPFRFGGSGGTRSTSTKRNAASITRTLRIAASSAFARNRTKASSSTNR
jgi:arginine decarboxylase